MTTQKGGDLIATALGANGLTGLGVPAALVLARDFMNKKKAKKTRKASKQKGGVRRYPGVGGKRKEMKTKTRRNKRYPGVGGSRKKAYDITASGAVAAMVGANEYMRNRRKGKKTRRKGKKTRKN
jgi:hypothetical protein